MKNYLLSLLDGDDTVLDGKVDEFRAGLDAQLLHHIVFMKFYGPRGNMQDIGYLLG
jgi:hypothetical protein